MNRSSCDQLAEFLVEHSREQVNGALAEHARQCAKCRRVLSLPALLASAAATPDEPAHGFAARVTASAQATLARRRRNRVALSSGGALAAAAMIAWFVIGVVPRSDRPGAMRAVVQREPFESSATPATPPDAPHELTDREIAEALVQLADPKLARTSSRQWRRISAQQAVYQTLLSQQGVSQ